MDAYYGSSVNSLISENRALLSRFLSLLSFAVENSETPVPSAFQPEVLNFEAENSSNSLYLSLLAGNLDSLSSSDPRQEACNFLTQNVSRIALGHSPHVWRRARR